MFFVIDKSKILSYVIAICTVVILFMLASGGEKANDIVPTSANAILNVVSNEVSNEMNSIVEQENTTN